MDGVVRSIIDFRRALEAQGHEVFIFAPGDRKTKKNNKDKHVFYSTAIPFLPYPDYKIAVFPFLKELTIRKLKIDLIHTHGMASMGLSALAASRMLNLPIVGTFHTMIPKAMGYVVKSKRMEKLAENTAWKYLHYYYGKCDAVLAPSEELKKELVSRKFKNVFTVPNGVDRQKFNENVSGKIIRDKYGGKLFMYLGRVASEKDIPQLLRALPFVLGNLKDAKLLIVGTGPAVDECKNFAEDIDIADKVFFTGFVSEEMVAAYYNATDVFVSPSSFETEGLCMLEALSCGKPAVGVNAGGAKYLVKNGFNGYLVTPKKPSLLAEAMIKAYAEKEQMRKNCLATADSLSLERCTKKLIDVYKKVLE